MKVIAFNGSARKNSNTQILIDTVLGQLKGEGIETESVSLAGQKMRGCLACRGCVKNQDKQCVVKDDIVNECISKMVKADGILLGSPTYFADISSELKALIDRAGYVARANNHLLSRKVGAGVVAVRRAGAMPAFATINNFFFISGMIVPGSTYWNVGIGRDKGDVNNDEEGLQTVKDLGDNMAWLLKKVNQ